MLIYAGTKSDFMIDTLIQRMIVWRQNYMKI